MVGIDRSDAGSTTVTVPADAQMMVCTTSGFRNSIGYFSGGSLRIGGQAMTLVQGGDASTAAWQGVMGYKVVPPTGARSLSWNWAGTSSATDRGGIMCAYYKDIDTASAVRSTSCTQSSSNPHTTGSIAAQTGDLAVAFVFQFVNPGTDTTFTWTGATEVTEFARVADFADGALAEARPSANLTIAASGAQNQDGGICGMVVRPAGGGPPPPPPPPPTVTLRNVDGGPTYYAQFANALPSTPAFFPIGVWGSYNHTQANIDLDKAAGLNTYVWVADNSFMGTIRANGMKVIQDEENRTNVGTETAGWLLADEIDMTQGPGAGYTTLQNIMNSLPQDGRLRYANYGKGVLAWETDSEASGFVNFPGLHLTSADMYFWTDLSRVCSSSEGGALWYHNGLLSSPRTLTTAECRGSWNYGYIVDRMRYLDGLQGGTSPQQRKPIWAFVELGWSFTESASQGGRAIQPAEVRSAVWHSVIAGARGIIYFQHSFGGPCMTHHVLRDACYTAIRTEVTTINQRLRALAPVLNAPFADGYVTASSGIRAMAKKGPDGAYYVFAGVKQAGTNQTATFRVAAGATVEVLNEGRTLTVQGGQFTDTFGDINTIHIYKITGG